MKLTINQPVDIVAKTILVNVPIYYGTEDVPNDLPLRRTPDALDCNQKHDRWSFRVFVDTGVIDDWPIGKTANVEMKVCDGGIYTLVHEILPFRAVYTKRIEDYIPRCLPDGGGDVINIKVDENGVIDQWHKYCTADNIRKAFFSDAEL